MYSDSYSSFSPSYKHSAVSQTKANEFAGPLSKSTTPVKLGVLQAIAKLKTRLLRGSFHEGEDPKQDGTGAIMWF